MNVDMHVCHGVPSRSRVSTSYITVRITPRWYRCLSSIFLPSIRGDAASKPASMRYFQSCLVGPIELLSQMAFTVTACSHVLISGTPATTSRINSLLRSIFTSPGVCRYRRQTRVRRFPRVLLYAPTACIRIVIDGQVDQISCTCRAADPPRVT